MKNVMRSLLYVILCSCSTIPAQIQSVATTPANIVTNKSIWGPDFPGALAYLQNWQKAGESKLVVYPNRIVGGTAYKDADATKLFLDKLSLSIKNPPATINPLIRKELTIKPDTLQRLKLNIVSFAEDSSYRLQWSSSNSKFIADKLTIEELYTQIGKPEKITTQLIEGRGEARPTILTLHHYANSAMVFAESDMSPIPGLIDRVYVDIPAVSKVVYKEGQ